MKRLHVRTSSRTRGQALAELALVLPVFLLLALAVFDIGRGVFLYVGLTNAAREGARIAIVNQDKALIGQRVAAATFAGAVANLGDLDNLVSFRSRNPDIDDPLNNAECPTAAIGCIAVVRPQAEWTLITPIVGSIIGPITLTARSEMPIEFTCPNASIPAYASSASCPRQP
jgi:Flp pilus assembly protein TadG